MSLPGPSRSDWRHEIEWLQVADHTTADRNLVSRNPTEILEVSPRRVAYDDDSGPLQCRQCGQAWFRVLYFGQDYHVALFEVQAMLGSPYPPAISVSNPQGKWALINVRVQLSNVADLTRPSQRKLIGTNVQELTGDWRGYLLRDAQSNLKAGAPFLTMVPTQRLGHELESVPRLEGFLSYSAKVPTKKNLIVFPKKLQANSFIKFENPITGQTQRIP